MTELPENDVDLAWIDTEVGAALAHGNELAESLLEEIRAWNAAHPVTMRGVIDRKNRSVTFVAEEFDEAPLGRWTQRVGDALHNWRRMLDTVAWDLSERYAGKLNKSQDRTVKFPLFDSTDAFDRACQDAKHWLSALDATHQMRLRKTQPFVARDPRQSVLHWLQDFDNRRKHRGGFSMRRVLDHDEGFLFMKLEDADGEDIGVPESALHRLSWGRTLIPGLPVIRVLARGITRAEGTHPIPIACRIKRDDDHETDMEHMILALSQQLAATVTVVYTGIFPPSPKESRQFGAWGLSD